jgi:hypothetical protein
VAVLLDILAHVPALLGGVAWVADTAARVAALVWAFEVVRRRRRKA